MLSGSTEALTAEPVQCCVCDDWRLALRRAAWFIPRVILTRRSPRTDDELCLCARDTSCRIQLPSVARWSSCKTVVEDNVVSPVARYCDNDVSLSLSHYVSDTNMK